MALSKLVFKPGINRDQTNYASEGGWYDMQSVRFRSGFPEKIGGWQVKTSAAYEGVARSLFPWNTSDGGNAIMLGTNEKIYINSGSQIYDITPIRATFTSTSTPNNTIDCLQTTSGSNQVEILNITSGAADGDWITFSGVDGFNGIPKSDFLTKSSALGETISTITRVATTATLTTIAPHGLITGDYVTVSGATPAEYNVSEAQITVTGTNTFTYVMASTPASSATVVGSYLVDTFDPREFKVSLVGSTYTITVDTAATSSGTGGGSNITAEWQINIGTSINIAGYGWGAGGWSRNGWGTGSTTPIFFPARLEFGQNFGDDLIFNIINGAIYYWAYDTTYSSRAVLLSSLPGSIAVPEEAYQIIFNPNGFLLALGCSSYSVVDVPGQTISTITHVDTTATLTTTTNHDLTTGDYITIIGAVPTDYNGQFQITVTGTDTFTFELPIDPGSDATTVGQYFWNNYAGGAFDPLLVRWSNVDPTAGPQPQVWSVTPTNSAGFLRIQAGSQIVAAINTRQETLVFTNSSLQSIQYLGTAEVFGIQQMSANISIMGPDAVVGTNNIIYWMGNDRFYIYSGRVDILSCTLRQYIFGDINLNQSTLITAGVNNQFGEIIWFYCSANSNDIDRYVIYNYLEQIWYFGQLNRTAWIDAGVFSVPVAAHEGYLYFQETGNDDGQPQGFPAIPMETYIQSADVDISDGDKFMLIRRVIPDVNFTGSSTGTTPEATLTVGVRNFPGATSSETNTEGNTTDGQVITSATFNQYTNQVFIRARGRQMNFRISSNTLGTQWQLGMPRLDARPDGMRG